MKIHTASLKWIFGILCTILIVFSVVEGGMRQSNRKAYEIMPEIGGATNTVSKNYDSNTGLNGLFKVKIDNIKNEGERKSELSPDGIQPSYILSNKISYEGEEYKAVQAYSHGKMHQHYIHSETGGKFNSHAQSHMFLYTYKIFNNKESRTVSTIELIGIKSRQTWAIESNFHTYTYKTTRKHSLHKRHRRGAKKLNMRRGKVLRKQKIRKMEGLKEPRPRNSAYVSKGYYKKNHKNKVRRESNVSILLDDKKSNDPSVLIVNDTAKGSIFAEMLIFKIIPLYVHMKGIYKHQPPLSITSTNDNNGSIPAVLNKHEQNEKPVMNFTCPSFRQCKYHTYGSGDRKQGYTRYIYFCPRKNDKKCNNKKGLNEYKLHNDYDTLECWRKLNKSDLRTLHCLQIRLFRDYVEC